LITKNKAQTLPAAVVVAIFFLPPPPTMNDEICGSSSKSLQSSSSPQQLSSKIVNKSSVGRRRGRKRRACDACHDKKFRCIQVAESEKKCVRCLKYGLRCSITSSPKKLGPANDELQVNGPQKKTKIAEDFSRRLPFETSPLPSETLHEEIVDGVVEHRPSPFQILRQEIGRLSPEAANTLLLLLNSGSCDAADLCLFLFAQRVAESKTSWTLF